MEPIREGSVQSPESTKVRPGLREILVGVVLATLGIAALIIVRDTIQPVRSQVSALRDGTVRERRQAARELGQLKRHAFEQAIEALPVALRTDKDAIVRTEAARSIGTAVEVHLRNGPRSARLDAAIQALIFALTDPDPNVREAAALAVSSFGRYTQYAPPELAETVVDDPELAVRSAAASSLVQFPKVSDRGVAVLLQGMDDPDPPLRLNCSDALSRVIPSTASLDDLIKALGHTRLEIRFRAADILGRLGPEGERAVPALIRNLSIVIPKDQINTNYHPTAWDPAWSASTALGRIAPGTASEKQVIEALSQNLKSKEIDRAVSASIALEAFGPRAVETVPLMLEALERSQVPPLPGDQGAAIANAIGVLAPRGPHASEAVAALIQGLKSRSEFTKARAAASLGRFGAEAKSALPALRDSTRNSSLVVRFEALRSIAMIGEN